MTLRRIGALLVPVLAALMLALLAIGTGRAVAAVLAAVAVVFGLALAAQAERYESTIDVLHDAAEWAVVLSPAILIVFFSFNGGGFSPAPVAFAAAVLALILALR